MVDANHAQRRALSPSAQLNWHSGLIEGRRDGIYRDRVMRVRTGGNELDQGRARGTRTYVSALTSQMTDRRLSGDERDSTLTKGGISADR